jgi:O-antigen/teichoic acid export membrane protein
MLKKIKEVLKHSFVYSLSNIALKASGIILLPIYTQYFTVEEYGRLGLLLITIILFSQSLQLGQGISIIRFNNSIEYKERQHSILFTITLFILGIIGVFIIISEIFLNDIAQLFGDITFFRGNIKICIYVIAAFTLNNLFLSKLRADEKSIIFTLSGIVKLIVMLFVTVYLVVYQSIGITGALFGQLAGELAHTIVMLPQMLKSMKFKLELKIIRESLRFGFPLIFSAMAINLLNGSDRYILKYFSFDTDLGLYELAYKVAGVLNMFLVMPLQLTLLPLAYKIYKKEGDKRYYSKIKTYIIFILTWAGLSLSVISYELIRVFAFDTKFYPAYDVVPLIVFAYVLYGGSMISSFGMYLTGKNHFIAYITLACATLNISLNFLLIPHMGMMGAAINTLVAFFLLDLFSYYYSNKYYKIQFENFKLLKIYLTGVLLFVVGSYFNDASIGIKIVTKLAVISAFPFLLYPLKFYEKAELKVIKSGLEKWRHPKWWIESFKKEALNNKDDEGD